MRWYMPCSPSRYRSKFSWYNPVAAQSMSPESAQIWFSWSNTVSFGHKNRKSCTWKRITAPVQTSNGNNLRPGLVFWRKRGTFGSWLRDRRNNRLEFCPGNRISLWACRRRCNIGVAPQRQQPPRVQLKTSQSGLDGNYVVMRVYFLRNEVTLPTFETGRWSDLNSHRTDVHLSEMGDKMGKEQIFSFLPCKGLRRKKKEKFRKYKEEK